MKIMAKQMTTIKLPDGQYTKTGKWTLKELIRVHVPDSKLTEDSDDGHGQQNLGICVINQSKIRWVLGTFKQFKSAGTDGIVPALLQQGLEHSVPHLCRLFKACMAHGFIPTAWRQVKLTFIPKPRKLDYTKAKAYRPISLSSFLLKNMKKLVDTHIRDSALKKYLLHRNKHAYQIGKSTETALHSSNSCN
jgi:hypothetical protein